MLSISKIKEIRTNRYVTNIVLAILVFLNLLSIEHLSRLRGNNQTFGESILPVLIAIISTLLLKHFIKIEDVRMKRFSLIGGAILAFTHVYGMYLHYQNDLFIDAMTFIIQILLVAGMMIFTVPLIALLFTKFNVFLNWWQSKLCEQAKPKFLFLKYWAIIFLCYLPLFLHWWPVNFIFDASYQLSEVINNAYKIHHPLLHTLLMGWCYKIGDALGSVSLGMSFYTLIQMLVLTASFAYTMVYLYQKKTPKTVRILILLFYALFPMHSVFSITATKDILFAAFFLFFFVLLVKLCYDKEKLTWQKIVGFLLSCILMILFRRNALYALILAIPFLILSRKGKRNKAIFTVLLIVCILLSNIINDSVIKAVKATNDDSFQESMSVPLQQVARVASYHKDDLDEDLYNELLMYWDESVFSTYNPYLSDNVKNYVDAAFLEHNLTNFWKLWGKIGLKFPGVYLESFLANTLGYWYLGDMAYDVGGEVSLYHMLIGTEKEILKQDLFPPASFIYDDLFHRMEYKDIPLLAYSYKSCVYFWLLLIYTLYIFYRKDYKKLIPALLPIAYLISCFFGPGVILRYAYCIIVSVPVIILLAFDKKHTS